MSQELNLLRDYEAQTIECLDLAIECGLDSDAGREAFHLAMKCFNHATDLKTRLIYAPLSDDPATADYVRRLDCHRDELMESIDILRSYIELTVEEADTAPDTLRNSMNRLRRRLMVLFKRETPLRSVFEAWQERQVDPLTGQSLDGTLHSTSVH